MRALSIKSNSDFDALVIGNSILKSELLKKRKIIFLPSGSQLSNQLSFDREELKSLLLRLKWIDSKTGCWHYCGNRGKGGYGRVQWESRSWRVHRISWLLFKGKIPERLKVLHKCDNPPCFNPAHLFVGTQGDNVRDAIKKGRLDLRAAQAIGIKSRKRNGTPFGLCGESNPIAKLTEKEVIEIRALYDSGHRVVDIAKQFNVTPTNACSIGRRRSWRYLS